MFTKEQLRLLADGLEHLPESTEVSRELARDLRGRITAFGTEERKRLVHEARDQYAIEGEVAIDDTAAISFCDEEDGAWVQAWLYVEDPG